VIGSILRVNPILYPHQAEGGSTAKSGEALEEQIAYADGLATSPGFRAYKLLFMSEAPETEAHLLESSEQRGSVGEPGLPLIVSAGGGRSSTRWERVCTVSHSRATRSSACLGDRDQGRQREFTMRNGCGRVVAA
jgi:hypothetical protein